MGADARAGARAPRPDGAPVGVARADRVAAPPDPADPAIAAGSRRPGRSRRRVRSRIDVVRARVAEARFHLAAGRPADAWRATRAAADLAGRQSSSPCTPGAHAASPSLPRPGRAGVPASPGRAARDHRDGAAPAAPLRPDRAVARPERSPASAGRTVARRPHTAPPVGPGAGPSGGRRLAMPYELARAHYELGRHLAVGDRAGHLERARSIFETLGCQADLAATGRVERETGVENSAR